MEVNVQSHVPAASLPDNHLRRGEVGLKASLEALEKITMLPSSRIKPHSSVVQPSLDTTATLPRIPLYFNNKGRSLLWISK
jgi:hypothetical protein